MSCNIETPSGGKLVNAEGTMFFDETSEFRLGFSYALDEWLFRNQFLEQSTPETTTALGEIIYVHNTDGTVIGTIDLASGSRDDTGYQYLLAHVEEAIRQYNNLVQQLRADHELLEHYRFVNSDCTTQETDLLFPLGNEELARIEADENFAQYPPVVFALLRYTNQLLGNVSEVTFHSGGIVYNTRGSGLGADVIDIILNNQDCSNSALYFATQSRMLYNMGFRDATTGDGVLWLAPPSSPVVLEELCSATGIRDFTTPGR
jgi:hypothetical protein